MIFLYINKIYFSPESFQVGRRIGKDITVPLPDYEDCKQATSCASCCDEKRDECVKGCEELYGFLEEICKDQTRDCANSCNDDFQRGSPEHDRCVFDCLAYQSECMRPLSDCPMVCEIHAEQFCRCDICGYDCNPIPTG